MDGFKVSEVKRMQLGGNKPWQDFYNAHKDNKLEGRTFDAATVKERYDCEVGEEWKERLTATVEEREYVPGARAAGAGSNGGSRSQTPMGASSAPRRTGSPAVTGLPWSKKAQNEAYFAKMGSENANRPEDLHPSQGGKFGGFGSEPAPAKSSDGDWLGEMSKDPLAGLTKGFGWLGKSAKTGFDGYIKPNVQKV